MIHDELRGATGADGKPLSRQRIWQLRKKKEGKCIVCGAPAVVATFCETHRIASNKRTCVRQGCKFLGRRYNKGEQSA